MIDIHWQRKKLDIDTFMKDIAEYFRIPESNVVDAILKYLGDEKIYNYSDNNPDFYILTGRGKIIYVNDIFEKGKHR